MGVTDTQEPEFSVVMEEVVRDVAVQWGMMNDGGYAHARKVVALHEVGHQFLGGAHDAGRKPDGTPSSIMGAPSANDEEWWVGGQTVLFNANDITTIRGIAFP